MQRYTPYKLQQDIENVNRELERNNIPVYFENRPQYEWQQLVERHVHCEQHFVQIAQGTSRECFAKLPSRVSYLFDKFLRGKEFYVTINYRNKDAPSQKATFKRSVGDEQSFYTFIETNYNRTDIKNVECNIDYSYRFVYTPTIVL